MVAAEELVSVTVVVVVAAVAVEEKVEAVLENYMTPKGQSSRYGFKQ